ncbi:MAG: hypothetical protein E7028_11630 [Planctomycetaceae bacterium]|nr:hypothetical protein [Planctomycetaceae bacterium]
MLNPFLIYLALTPLALYFVLLGLMNMTGRPFLVTGFRDQIVLFLALSGLIAIGPVQLFFPVNASWSYGPATWLFLLGIYVLACTLYLLLQRPSLNLYNLALTEFRPFFADSVVEWDPESRMAGDTVFMPTLGIQFYVESTPFTRTISLISAGPNQNWDGWKIFQKKLMEDLKKQAETFSPKYSVGIFFMLLGLFMLIALHILIWINSAAFLKAIPDFLRL